MIGQTISHYLDAIRIEPDTLNCYLVGAGAYRDLGRFDNADALLALAQQRKIGGTGLYVALASSAILRGDSAGAAQMEQLAQATPEGELRMLGQQAEHAGALGQLGQVRQLRARVVERAKGLNMPDFAASQLIEEANAEAAFGYPARAREQIDAALALSRDPAFVMDVADANSAAGQDQKAEALLTEVRKARPDDTFLQKVVVARVEARLQMRQGKAAAAVETLAIAQPYENGQFFATHVLRGQAYLASGDAANAASEFRKYLSRRSLAPFSIYYPLAQLGLARALAAQHDAAGARTAYQDLFAMWKNADPDLPVIKQAKAEYAKLQ